MRHPRSYSHIGNFLNSIIATAAIGLLLIKKLKTLFKLVFRLE